MDQLPLNRGTFQNAQTPEHNNPVDRWAEAHISLVLHTSINSGVDAFENALQDSGAVVAILPPFMRRTPSLEASIPVLYLGRRV